MKKNFAPIFLLGAILVFSFPGLSQRSQQCIEMDHAAQQAVQDWNYLSSNMVLAAQAGDTIGYLHLEYQLDPVDVYSF